MRTVPLPLRPYGAAPRMARQHRKSATVSALTKTLPLKVQYWKTCGVPAESVKITPPSKMQDDI